MRRAPLLTTRLGSACVLLASLVLWLAACGEERAPQPPKEATGPSCPPPVDMSDAPLTAEETKALEQRVAASILLTGGHLGKHKPCGCTQPQMGGVERLAALKDRLATRSGGNVLGLALGWTLAGNAEPQEESKAEFIREVFQTLEFQGLLLGETDLSVPAMTADYGGGGVQAPVPPINVILGERSALLGKSNVLDVLLRQRRVRVATVVDPNAPEAQALKMRGLAREVLGITTAFNQMQPDPDALWIVAARLHDKEAYDALRTALQGQGPAIVVDLSGGLYGQEVVKPQPLTKDLSLLVSLDEKGKGAGVLDILVDGQNRVSIAYRHFKLRPGFAELPSASRSRVKETLGYYLDSVRERDLVSNFPTVAPTSEATYVGKFKCVACHLEIYRDYEQTAHAGALGTLEDIQYAWDPECVRCHVVGWTRMASASGADSWFRYPTGFKNIDKTRELGGVGCENCHGPGSLHWQDPTNNRMFMSKDGLEGWKSRCMQCHDADNSPGFIEHGAWYFQEVNHHDVPSDKRTVLPR